MKETVLRAHSVIHIIGPLDMTSGQGGLPMQMNIKEPPQQKPTAKNILVKKKPRRKRKKKTVDKETMTSMADLINQKPLPKLFECDICVAKFDNQQDLDGHLEEDHQSMCTFTVVPVEMMRGCGGGWGWNGWFSTTIQFLR